MHFLFIWDISSTLTLRPSQACEKCPKSEDVWMEASRIYAKQVRFSTPAHTCPLQLHEDGSPSPHVNHMPPLLPAVRAVRAPRRCWPGAWLKSPTRYGCGWGQRLWRATSPHS